LKDGSMYVATNGTHYGDNMERVLKENRLTRNLRTLQNANERMSASLEFMQFMFTGVLSFAILDRYTGAWTVINTEWMRAFANTMMRGPYVWFFVNMLFWGVLTLMVMILFYYRNYRSQGITTLRMKMMKKINVQNLSNYLLTKCISTEDREYDMSAAVVMVTFTTDKCNWGGAQPRITLEYEELNGYMLNMTLTYNRRVVRCTRALNANELRIKLMDELKAALVFEDE